MDEFSWFVGLYEGEGCYYRENLKGCSPRGILQIDMTDEDTIKRAADFLGCKYRQIKVRGNRKPQWRVAFKGGVIRGRVYNLMKRMYPYLSERRKTQLNNVWEV